MCDFSLRLGIALDVSVDQMFKLVDVRLHVSLNLNPHRNSKDEGYNQSQSNNNHRITLIPWFLNLLRYIYCLFWEFCLQLTLLQWDRLSFSLLGRIESLRLDINNGRRFLIGSGLSLLRLVQIIPHLFSAFFIDDREEEGAFVDFLGSSEEVIELIVIGFLVFVYDFVTSGDPTDHKLSLVNLLPQSRVLDVEGSRGHIGLRPKHTEGGTHIHHFLQIGLDLHQKGVTLKRIGRDSSLTILLTFLITTMPILLFSISTHLEEMMSDDIGSFKYHRGNEPNNHQICCLQAEIIQFVMNQEETLRDQLQTYNCLICHTKAHKPIITRCGHLFCWQCFYKQDERSEVPCVVCGSLTEKNDTYPVFIEQDMEKDEDANIPDRPLPVNRPKIPNSDIIGARSNQYRNNIAIGQQMAGFVYLAPLAVTAYNTIEEAEDGDAEKSVSIRLKCVFILVFTILVILLGVDLLI